MQIIAEKDGLKLVRIANYYGENGYEILDDAGNNVLSSTFYGTEDVALVLFKQKVEEYDDSGSTLSFWHDKDDDDETEFNDACFTCSPTDT